MKDIGRIASGFVYYVSLKGVTGSGAIDTQSVADMVPRIRAHVSAPVGVGFGIRDAQTAKAVAAVSDAVLIGPPRSAARTQTRDNVVPAGAAFIAEIRAARFTEEPPHDLLRNCCPQMPRPPERTPHGA